MNPKPTNSRRQWRSLAEFESGLEIGPDEFAPGSSDPPSGVGRREFLRVMGASAALAGAAGCTRQPKEEIIPYVNQPEGLVLGEARYYATATDLGGHAHGLLVCSHEGRPTKIEGNPDHPSTRGRSNVLLQAAVLDLYDPDRSKTIRHENSEGTWEELFPELLAKIGQWKPNGGEGVRFLLDRRTSPTLYGQLDQLRQKYPKLTWHRYDAAFPEPAQAWRYDLDRAKVILSFDDDFLGAPDASPASIAAFAKHRNREGGMNRLYVVESMPSITGATADHRLVAKPSEIVRMIDELADAAANKGDPKDTWLAAVWKDLRQNRGASAVLVSVFLPPVTHEKVRAINDALGNTGQTILPAYSRPPAPGGGLGELVDAMRKDQVKDLFIFGVNPIYTAAPDLHFADALKHVPFTLHLGLQVDETAEACKWHVAETHFLEAWSDAEAEDGTYSLVQPLIEPMYASKSAHELLATLLEQIPSTDYDILRAAAQARHKGNFEAWWRRVLHDGVESKAALAPNAPPALPAPAPAVQAPQSPQKGLELRIRPHPYMLDGRQVNNAWLQELPQPITKLCWGNAAFLSPRTATDNALKQGDIVEWTRGKVRLDAPVFILPGHADHCVTLHLGYGRPRAGRVGNGVGFAAVALQISSELWSGAVELRKTTRQHTFTTVQEQQRMEGRDLVHHENVADPPGSSHGEPPPPYADSLYPPVKYESPAWGMVIDLSRCIGCMACTIACQAENNIPVVGPEQVRRERIMHWIRVDRYYGGSPEEPEIHHQPVPCMHCENAPCELVCPVGATLHDHQGLNLMVYNRCVGTRYCSNNCPYKVRRFNFLQFSDDNTPQLKLQRNPDVTVRMRGVMEKCTYCVQRIAVARIRADKEDRAIREGEVVPACVQTCPADAISFGDILNKASRVSQQRQSPLNYSLLEDLNTRPRTTYLSKIQNPNPEMPKTV